MWKEFKAFALRGNVVDLAVAVIIGGAFKTIVSSFVDDMVMPLIGLALGGVNFRDLRVVLAPATADAAEVAIRYGAFVQAVVDFLIIAGAIFLAIRLVTGLRRKQQAKEEEPVPAPVPTAEEVLLAEIRDLLAERSGR